MAMEVIHVWAYIDLEFCRIYAQLADTDVLAATETLTKLPSRLRRERINEAAQSKLPAEKHDLFKAAMDSIRESANTRNDFAHHVWGRSTLVLDALLLANPNDLALHSAKFQRFIETAYDDVDWEKTPEPPRPEFPRPYDNSKAAVYYRADLEKAVEDAARAWKVAQTLVMFVMTSIAPKAADAVREELSTDPQIRSRLPVRSTQRDPNDPQTVRAPKA
jgi:hypothetical protein